MGFEASLPDFSSWHSTFITFGLLITMEISSRTSPQPQPSTGPVGTRREAVADSHQREGNTRTDTCTSVCSDTSEESPQQSTGTGNRSRCLQHFATSTAYALGYSRGASLQDADSTHFHPLNPTVHLDNKIYKLAKLVVVVV